MSGTASTFTSQENPPASTPPPRGWLPAILMALVTAAIAILACTGASPSQQWAQGYDPFGHWWLSALCAALPVVVMLTTLAIFRLKAHYAAFLGLVTAIAIASALFHMPIKMASITAIYGALYGLFPIGWIILNVIFLYRMTLATGRFKVLQQSMTGITQDTRLQLLLIAFSFGAFFEGASGFGTPVAVTAALLIGLGFKPLQASGLSLIANTAPVAFGALGTPIVALAAVSGYSEFTLGAQIGRILPFFSMLVPFWLIWVYAGFKGMKEIWPAIAVAGVGFAIPQFLVSNYHGPWLTDIVAAVCSMLCLVLFLRIWQPMRIWGHEGHQASEQRAARGAHGYSRSEVIRAWLPWLVLSVTVFCWGTYTGRKVMNTPEKVFPSLNAWRTPPSNITNPQIPVPGLNKMVQRVPPVVAKPTAEAAVFGLNWLSATGSGILFAATVSGFIMGLSLPKMFMMWWQTLWHVRFSMITIAVMMALGIVTRYSGVDATMGLAFARTGHLYPFFGTLLGWLGVALTGSDTASNVLFGSLQKISAQQIGISPVLMASANSGVMGKMIDAQSIVVASTATEWYGGEGDILRYVFWHSIALACLVGVLVLLEAYVAPFTRLVVK
jgi:lactate permease